MADWAETFVSEGYVVVEQLISDVERQAMIEELMKFARGEYPIANPPKMPDDASDQDRLDQILAVHFPHWVSPVIEQVVRHPRLAEVLGQITGAHIPYWDGRVKAMQSMLFAKPPGLPGQAWHQDERYIPTRDRSLVGAWIALDDAEVENGCLRVLPQSHRPGKLYPLQAHGKPEEFDPGEEAYGFEGFDGTGEIAVEVKAGDVIFFNGYLLHRSKRNASADRPRRALVNHYCSAWSNLPWMTREGLDIGVQDYRTILPVVGDDPYPERPIEPGPNEVFLRPASGAYTDAQEIIAD